MSGVVSWWQQRKLQSGKTDTRLQAVGKLASHTDDGSSTAVLEALADADPLVRSAAAKSVGQRKDKHAAQPLCVLALYDNDRIVTAEAVAALRSIGPQAAVPFLKTALDHPECAISHKAASLLHNMAWNCLDDVAKARIAVDLGLWSEVCELGEHAIEPLSAMMQNGTKRMKREAAEALAQISHSKAFQILIDAMENWDCDAGQREVATWALTKYRADEMSLTQGAISAIVRGAWSEVSDYGDDAITPLVEVMNRGSLDEPSKAIKALGRVKSRTAVEILEKTLLDSQNDLMLRESAAAVLVKVQPPCDPKIWRQLLQDDNWKIRTEAANYLTPEDEADLSKVELAALSIVRGDWDTTVAIGPEAVPALLNSLQFVSITKSVAKALQHIGGDAIDALLQVVRDGNQAAAIREIIAGVLSQHAEPLALEPLKQMLRDEDIAVRYSAVWSLERLDWKPEKKYETAIQAMAHDDWAKVETLGSEAMEPVTRMIEQGLAQDQGLTALEAILKSCASRVGVDQLRKASLLSTADGFGGQPNAQTSPSDRATRLKKYETVRKLAKYELIRRGLAF